MPIPEDTKLPKTNFWLTPLLGVVFFILFGCGYAYLVLCVTLAFGLLKGNYFRFAGLQLYVHYGPGSALFLLGIIVIAGLLSAITTMMLLKSIPKALSALRKSRTET